MPSLGLHPCVGCGVELDGDDSRDRCGECEPPLGLTVVAGTEPVSALGMVEALGRVDA